MMVRAFIAIPLPEEIRRRIGAFQREWQTGLREDAVRWAPVEQIHLTLRFLGKVPEAALPELESALRRACEGVSGFELVASGSGCFPDPRKPRVLWVGLRGALPALADLQAKIAGATSAWGELEEREFHPHLTIGRVKQTPPVALRQIWQDAQTVTCGELGCWHVGEVLLMRSELSPAGAKHTALARAALGA
jgi:2'-5' RNA ligase